MKIHSLPVEEALSLGQQLPYAYITELSRVVVGHTPVALEQEELLEARFFGLQEEIHIYQTADGLAAIALTENEDDLWIDHQRRIRDPKFGHSLTVREYISYDTDGQAYISHIRLLDWKEVTP